MTKVLLIGGSGFVGNLLAKYLSSSGQYQVTVASREKTNVETSRFTKMDLLDKGSVKRAVFGQDVVVNLAGQISSPINQCFEVNSKGISNLIESLIDQETWLIHISTVAVYGTTEIASEEHLLNPETPYGTIKAFAEHLILNSDLHEKSTILRLSNLYGPGQTRGFFAYLRRSIRTDRQIHLNNDGTMFRDFLHLEDCLQGIVLSIEKRLAGVFNLASGHGTTIRDLIALVEEIHNLCFYKYFEPSLAKENIKRVDISKLQDHMGFKPQSRMDHYIQSQLM